MSLLDRTQLNLLPPPVQRCLVRSGVVGRPVPDTVHVKQSGRIRLAPDKKWLRFTADESYRVERPEFEWNAAVHISGVPAMRARDSLEDGRGRMSGKLFRLIKIMDETGPEMDQGALMRWLNETMWFPAVWATEVIKWEEVDDQTALARVAAAGTEASGEFKFDGDGRMIDFVGDRYRGVEGGRFELTRWSTPITSHRTYNGIELPAGGSALWWLNDGTFEYIQIQADRIDYQFVN